MHKRDTNLLITHMIECCNNIFENFRNILIHDYFEIKHEIVWTIIRELFAGAI